jgi:hypothetical protein
LLSFTPFPRDPPSWLLGEDVVKVRILERLTKLRNGELKEYIAAGVSKHEFMRRMKGALAPPQAVLAQPLPAQTTASQNEAMAVSADSTSQPSRDNASSSSSGQATPPTPSESRMAERPARLSETEMKEEEEAKRRRAEKEQEEVERRRAEKEQEELERRRAEKEQEELERRRAEKGKAKAEPEPEPSEPKGADEKSKHAAALAKKKLEAQQERVRILKAIEADKVARRAEKAAAEAERKAAAASEKANATPSAPANQSRPSTRKVSEHCAIQVRLLDGSTIRNRFSSHETLKDVRKWVDETREDGKEAYTFKVLLTPLPSKTIDVTEEGESLQALGLVPSSTLILLRVSRSSSAYSSAARPVADSAAPEGNVIQRFIGYILAIITGLFSNAVAFFSTLLSTTGPPAAAPEPSSSQTSQSQGGSDAARRRRGRIAGVDHTDGRRNDQQFYNGNSVSHPPLQLQDDRLTLHRPILSPGQTTGSSCGFEIRR